MQQILKDNNKNVLLAHYGDLVKYICQKFWGWNGLKDENGRHILQNVGTDLIRKVFPNYWVDFIIQQVKFTDNKYDYVLVPDTRFPNEIERWKETGLNIITVRVNRPNFESDLTEEQKNHPSETALDNYKFDYIISAEGLDNLVAPIREILKREDESITC
ncbi:deoxynucleotide monophosphate kinase family protein [Anaerovorax sp. IOR16]|uniref:deoxynucleotide monophosphate kinase family protein n=1 Tax=Anaerovorax sp. IOR16 TaxID=2773458 RepID=UPI0019D136A5|nr:hypothetical protein [Anaerovorax sp. IOR16]